MTPCAYCGPDSAHDTEDHAVEVCREGTHERNLQDPLRCVYCCALLAPYNCNGCGQFLSAERMREGFGRCEGCE